MTQGEFNLKKLLTLLAAGVLTLGVAGSAFASSTEPTIDHDNDPDTPEQQTNQVDCGEATQDLGPLGQINAEGGAEGGTLEACTDGDGDDALPIQGAVYVTGSPSDGGQVAADGDADNDDPAGGWAGADTNGNIGCGPDNDTDSRDGLDNADLANCG